MSLVKSTDLFAESSFPVRVDDVEELALMQKHLHCHECFIMLYVEKGEFVTRFKNSTLVLSAGDLLIMKPYVMHVLMQPAAKRRAWRCGFIPQVVDSTVCSLNDVRDRTPACRYYFESFLSLEDSENDAVQYKLNRGQRAAFREMLSRLQELSMDRSDKAEAMSRIQFLNLLTWLSWQHDRGELRGRTHHLSAGSTACQSGLRKTLGYIQNHFEEPLRFEGMVEMSCATRSYFCRMIKRETGMTFHNYLNSLRIERACMLLRDTCDSAAGIGCQVGFNDYSHFHRQFKRYTGQAPGAYRKNRFQPRAG